MQTSDGDAARVQPSDEALVLACRRGDEVAWEALVWRYQRLVYSVARRAGLRDDLAAEVFQQVFAKLVEQLHRLEQPRRIGAWLVTAARRESWRLGRLEAAARVATAGVDEDGAMPDVPDDAPPLDEALVRLEEQHRVRTAVAALDERCRTLLTLLFFRPEAPPYAEIASVLGTPEGSIGPTRARCLQKLRRLLGDGADSLSADVSRRAAGAL